jgi:molecular chaperone DnaK (HSP70)
MFGDKFSDGAFRDDRNLWPFKTVAGPDDSVVIEFTQDGKVKQLKPYEVSALMLRSLVDMANTHHQIPSNRVVITVPVNSTADQREGTVKAARKAGLEVLRVVDEPTAAVAAFAFITKPQGMKTVLVYDFGGSSLDVSIVDVAGWT